MSKRLVIVAGAAGVAGVILAITLLTSPPAPDTGPDNEPPITTEDLPPGLDPTQLTSADPRRGPVLRSGRGAGGGDLTSVGDNRITVLFWEGIDPVDEGVFNVTQPSATVQFLGKADPADPQAPRPISRILTIRSDAATIIAPDNKPRRGEFRDNVVVSLHEPDAEGRIDLDSDAGVALRVYLDEDTTFDLDLGQITSSGPVHLTGPRYDFKGVGLNLKYNQLLERIERLVVREGRSLRFAAEEPGVRSRESGGRSQESGDRGQGAGTGGSSDKAPQPYRARLMDHVEVKANRHDPAKQVEMAGEALDVVFAIEPRRGKDKSDGGSVAPAAEPDSDATSATRDTPIPPTPRDPRNPDDPRSLMSPRDSDIVVTWTGPLEVRPLEADAAEVGAGDARLSIEGSPARITTGRDQTITGASVGFLTADQTLIANADDDTPLQLIAPGLGTLAGSAMRISQLTGEGEVLGPGSVESGEWGVESEVDTSHSPPSTLHSPRGRITWADRLDLKFVLNPKADDGQRLTALRHAQFYGQVRARHEDFHLAGDHVEMLFAPDADDPLRTHPSRLFADGNVTAGDAGLSFKADRLTAELAPDAAKTRRPAATDTSLALGSGDVRIERITAEGHIVVESAEQGATITADRLLANPDAQTLELFGVEERLARVTRADGGLAGRHLVLDRAAQTVRVAGPGDFNNRIDPDKPDEMLAIAWRDRMSFDNRAGHASFVGGVDAGTDGADSTTELTSNELQLTFVPEAPDQAEDIATDPRNPFDAWAEGIAATAPDAPRPAPPAPPNAAASRLRSMVATGDVTFSATAKQMLPDGRPTFSLYIEGPVLTFDSRPNADPQQVVEQFQVVGAGQMGIENYGPTDSADAVPDGAEPADTSPAETAARPVNFAGRGATAFRWEDKLTLDAARNDVLFEGGVVMVHQPADRPEGEVLQLDCKTLRADLSETGGLGSWSKRDETQAAIRQIDADGAVRLVSGSRVIQADHLRYTADDQLVVLWGDGRNIEFFDEQNGASSSAKALEWDLGRNRITPKEFTGVAPIGRD